MRLLTSYHSRILHYICSLVSNRTHAEDVMQEVSIALWEKRDQYDPDRNFFVWMRGFAKVKVLTYYRQQSRAPCQLTEDTVQKIIARVDSNQHAVEDHLAALRYCLQQLPEEQRLLLGKFYKPMADVELIAEEFNIRPSTVYVRVHRIRKSLLQCVHQYLARLKVLV
ncbi:sigma-70 family RNA polymerase sigma factor [Blastopirellula sp. J2-11]|uniref:sigma-70 family RNA polymerase sigma factor n=1 Tax=Blastopirellula sp. J2-11 TaxID=2943192 RepID=UPI0021C56769|nr:sigma-70 family RNA polymerase sigma factor [Blastopirellula sp. J2-11]UUO04869.1 sigma-70 family RNA polymerase sigma factor [Blastopirellula sp. J2-11]